MPNEVELHVRFEAVTLPSKEADQLYNLVHAQDLGDMRD